MSSRNSWLSSYISTVELTNSNSCSLYSLSPPCSCIFFELLRLTIATRKHLLQPQYHFLLLIISLPTAEWMNEWASEKGESNSFVNDDDDDITSCEFPTCNLIIYTITSFTHLESYHHNYHFCHHHVKYTFDNNFISAGLSEGVFWDYILSLDLPNHQEILQIFPSLLPNRNHVRSWEQSYLHWLTICSSCKILGYCSIQTIAVIWNGKVQIKFMAEFNMSWNITTLSKNNNSELVTPAIAIGSHMELTMSKKSCIWMNVRPSMQRFVGD